MNLVSLDRPRRLTFEIPMCNKNMSTRKTTLQSKKYAISDFCILIDENLSPELLCANIFVECMVKTNS